MPDERVLAVCRACGRGYPARAVDGRLVVPTDDGRCVCGNPELSVERGVTYTSRT